MKHLLFLLCFAVLFFGCSKDDDVTKPEENDSLITGKWVTQFWTTTGSEYDSVQVHLNLSGKEGKFTGQGTVEYSFKRNFSVSRYKFEDDAAGTYSENEINATVVSSLSGNTYLFTGTRDDVSGTTRYKGVLVLKINNESVQFDNITLFKSE